MEFLRSKKARVVLLFGALLAVLILIIKSENEVDPVEKEPLDEMTISGGSEEVVGLLLIGDRTLADYATAKTTLKEDLELFRRVNISFVTLVKNHANLPIGCNEDLADALRGENPHKQRFISDDHPAFNDKGQIIDRYGSTIHLHVPEAGRYEMRSAGADKTLWTDDDVEILPSGEFK